MKILVVFFILVFLIGCTGSVDQKVENESASVVNQTKLVVENKSSKCEASWKCIGKWKKGYLGSDCNWSQETECRLGCKDGKCNLGKVCEVGFKCISENKKGYQTESCGWINTKRCPGGCLKGECLPEPVKNETVNKTVEVKSSAIDDSKKEEVVKDTMYVTKLTETSNITLNKKNYIIQIYNFEGDRVKIKVNDIRGDWLKEGESFTDNGEITLTLKEILYQAYAGGKQQVGYTLK